MRPIRRPFFGLSGLLLLWILAAAPASGQTGNILPPNTDPTVNQPPLQPAALEPINGSTINPTGDFVGLRGTEFHDPNPRETPNGQHKASQWMVYTQSEVVIMIYPPPPDVIQVIVDSGVTAEYLTAYKFAKNLLTPGKKYFWKVRYRDGSGNEATQWSPWSNPAWFILAAPPQPTPDPAVNQPPLQPAALLPVNGSTVNPSGDFVGLKATEFRDPNPRETPNGQHKASQWMVYTQNIMMGATNPVGGIPDVLILDSGPTGENLTTFPLPKKLLTVGTRYFWKVRYCDASGVAATQWSPWSNPASFILGAPPEPTPDPTVNQPPLQPYGLEPRNGAMIRPQGEFIALRASAFRDPNSPETPNGKHKYSHWQVYHENPMIMAPGAVTDSNTAPIARREIILDSGPTTKSLTMFLLPKKLLKSGTMYQWTVRYCDASGEDATQWGPWSDPAAFATAPEVVKELDPARLKVGPARPGVPLYSDKNVPIILRMPQTLWSQTMIRTLSTDAKTSGPGKLISFKSDLPVSVVVAYDDRASTLPQWLWPYKPYRPILPILMNYVVSGTATTQGATSPSGTAPNTLVRGGDLSIAPVPPERIPAGIWKMLVSDREAPNRRLLVRDYAAGEAISLGKNLPAPGVDTKTTASLRMYGVIVQPKWMGVITPLPQPVPVVRPTTTRPTTTDPATNTGSVTVTSKAVSVKPALSSTAPAVRTAPKRPGR